MLKFKTWLENIDPNIMARDTHNLKRQYLNFNKLNRKAFKVTYPSGIKSDSGFSIVTPFNRESWNWEIHPEMEKLVKDNDILNGNYNGKPNLDDAKYMQIIMSAKKLGLM